jgi:hypothetical protein
MCDNVQYFKLFFESLKAHGFAIVFVKQHFFQSSFEFTKCEWKYDEKYDNAINCMKSRTPLLPNS